MGVRTDSLNIISLCTGGGGLDLGVELAIPSARSVVLLERESFAISQLVSAMESGLMAPAPVWSDVTTFNGREWRGLVDGVIGGIPCQPHSLAGKREGEEDERDLWSDARRIIVQSGAWWCLIENVRGMLSAKPGLDPGALRVRRDLQRLGFRVEGGLFTAAEVGASHERERVFILGVADRNSHEPSANGAKSDAGSDRRNDISRRGKGIPGVGLADAYSERLEGVGTDTGAPGREDARRPTGLRNGAVVEHAIGGRRSGRQDEPVEGSERRASAEWPVERPLFPPGPDDLRRWGRVLSSSPELEPAFRRVADGLASRLDTARVDRLRMLGNGVVPLQAAHALRTLATRLSNRGSAGAAELVRLMVTE